ncbi:MAG: hypothetical protein V3U02_09200 [Calditrichia bacterium]
MKERILLTDADLQKAARDLTALTTHLPVVLTVTQGTRIRSTAANARYWSGLNEYLDQMNEAINRIEENGYTNLESRKVIASELSTEHAAILYCTNAESIHNIIKLICGVPTSTRLGTKEFQKFESVMEGTLAEIIGEIKAVAMKA